MTDICPITYAKRRVEERGYSDFRMVFRDLQVQPNEPLILKVYNELWLVLQADDAIRVESDYGIYDYGQSQLAENIHEHADHITIINKGNVPQKIRFLQVIMRTTTPKNSGL